MIFFSTGFTSSSSLLTAPMLAVATSSSELAPSDISVSLVATDALQDVTEDDPILLTGSSSSDEVSNKDGVNGFLFSFDFISSSDFFAVRLQFF